MKKLILSLAFVFVASTAQAQDFPPRAGEIVRALYQQHLELAHSQNDDDRRTLTRTIIEQIVFEMGSSWGGKSADPTRPFSKDSIAHIGLNGVLWGCDWQNGTTRAPHNPITCQDISGQNFIPVAGKNHLASEPEPPGNGGPIPPTLPVSELLNKLDNIFVVQTTQTAQAERIFSNLTAQLQALSAQVAAVDERVRKHDEEPMWLTKVMSNRYVQIIGAALAARFALPRE